MALSKSVSGVFRGGTRPLRNALAYAARNERPYDLRSYRKDY